MKKEFLEIGKIVGTHGVKGMVRIQAWCDSVDFLKGFKCFYIDAEKRKLELTSIKPNGNVVIAQIKGVETIEQAEKLRNKVFYIKRDDAKLPEGRYFISELIGCAVFDADTNASLGTLVDVSETGANDVWHIKKDEKEYLVPAIPSVIVSVDIEKEIILLKPLKGIFDNEN